MHFRAPLLLALLASACSWEEVLDDSHTGTGGGASTGSGASSNGAAGSGIGGSGAAGSGGGLPATSGCGVNAPSGVGNRSLDVRGVTRSYVLSVPDDYDSIEPYSLVFAWHGQDGDGALARRYFGVEDAADGRTIFVYPDGLPQSQADGDTAWDLSPDGVDVALFDALLASLYTEYCIDASRIFSTGHSYGAYMTNRLACSRANMLRGVAPVAGGPPFGPGRNAPCSYEVAAFLVHGQDDVDVEFAEGEAARDRYLRANGCAATTHAVSPAPCVTYDGCSEGHPVVWCMHPGYHDWPDFAGAGIWDFFSELE